MPPVVLPDRVHQFGTSCTWRGRILYKECVVCGTITNQYCKKHDNYVCITCIGKDDTKYQIINSYLDAQADSENSQIKQNMPRPKVYKYKSVQTEMNEWLDDIYLRNGL